MAIGKMPTEAGITSPRSRENLIVAPMPTTQHGLPCSCLLFAGMHMRLLDREELMMVENVCLTDDSWVVGDLTRTLTEGDGRGGRRLVGKL
jgi:hypothetical protein